MQLEISRSLARRQFLCGCCGGAVIAWVSSPAVAAGEAVPARLEPHHHNDRLRVWRLRLQPGQRVPPIVQSGPGLRVILSGDRIMEALGDAPDREVAITRGEFEWQPPGVKRELRNTGTTLVELVEFELR